MSRKEIKEALNVMHDASAEKAEAYAKYNKRKLHAQLLETQNDSTIIVFPSVDAPWYKIGWTSALIYAYDVGIRACPKNSQPVIRKDTDQAARSKDGIVFVRDIEKMIKRMADIGYTSYEETRDGLYIFDLKKTYTKAELKAFRNTAIRKNEELFNMVTAKRVYPELRGLIVKSASMMLPKCKNLHSFYQSTLGQRMVTAVLEMNAAYFDLANKRVEAKDAFVTIVKNANLVLADLTVVSEVKLWSPIELMEVGGLMVDIKMCVARIIKKGKDRAGDGRD